MFKTITKLLVILLVTLTSFLSCQYDFVFIEEQDEDIPVLFSEHILPIFENQRCTSCHQSNYTEIDFTKEEAYNTIVPELIDTLQPELSRIYEFPNPASSEHQFKKYNPDEAIQVLNWIKQGAQNN